LAGGFERMSTAVRRGSGWAELDHMAGEIIALAHHAAPAAAVELATAVTHDVVLQPCLRDIWSDHVLFVGDRVSGLVDFGALRPESVAGDVARLLGSLAGDDPVLWPAGLVAYEAVRPLSPVERSLVAAFDRSAVVLSGLNWLDWIYRDARDFEEPGAVLVRIEDNLKRLRSLAKGTGRRVG
jgi:homoserine kinase type II